MLVAAMTGGTGRIYGGGTSGSMPIILVHRRRGVPRRPSRRRRPGPLPRLINSYYLKYHIRVCMRRIRSYATVCVWQGPGYGWTRQTRIGLWAVSGQAYAPGACLTVPSGLRRASPIGNANLGSGRLPRPGSPWTSQITGNFHYQGNSW